MTKKRLRTHGGVWTGQLNLLGLCGHGNMGLTCREVNKQCPGYQMLVWRLTFTDGVPFSALAVFGKTKNSIRAQMADSK